MVQLWVYRSAEFQLQTHIEVLHLTEVRLPVLEISRHRPFCTIQTILFSYRDYYQLLKVLLSNLRLVFHYFIFPLSFPRFISRLIRLIRILL